MVIRRAVTLTATTATVVTLSLSCVSNAKAHFIPHKKHMTLQEKVAYFDQSITHDQKAIAWIYKYRKAVVKFKHQNKIDRTLSTEVFPSYEYQLRLHKKALKWHTNLYYRYNQKYQKTLLPPHYNEWLCIHRYEGSWTDPNAPFYGGLQMDIGFQQTYGASLLKSKGTADNWTPLEQMWVAEKAYHSGRGFYPWPNTARYCGLI